MYRDPFLRTADGSLTGELLVGPPSPHDIQEAAEALLRLAVHPKAHLAAEADLWQVVRTSPFYYPHWLLRHIGHEDIPTPPRSLYADNDYGDGD